MAIDEAVLYHAKRHHRAALEQLLLGMYPAVHRMAYGLSGREDVGRGIVRFVMKQAASRALQWRDADAAERWFSHHTVLTARRAARHQPMPNQETLCRGAGDAQYVAFVRALRALPIQQREAFILHRGEKMNTRSLAIAMDCSTTAAQTHLKLATTVLETLSNPSFERMVEEMARAYQALVPKPDSYNVMVKKYVARSLWPRRVMWAALGAGLLVLAGLAVWAWLRLGHWVGRR
jgi:DNA-directed RNA polymerase specialized sigma24 family protein